MSRKINYKSISPFHDRLYSIIGDDVQDWARKLQVTPSTISNRWYRGSFPTADKVIKLVELSGVSSDWLLEGKEVRCTLPPGYDEFYAMLQDILLQSSDEQVKHALRTNLVAFRNSINKDVKKQKKDKRIELLERDSLIKSNQIEKLEKTVEYLKELYDRKTQSDT